ncbi:glucose repression mediator protein [Rhizophlyctis rosea]|uniref:Glucose repression mediator protein n=1 Tax=Rhizophlyctis rosea TaxID=64517 RepID=A0AAD5X2Y9_9FUNG|nr:glucose repression mediator protein [Rhizophlyctis rosea]
MSTAQKLQAQNEQNWLQVGTLAESMNEPDRAMSAYESALRHNPYSIPALTQIAALCRAREQYGKAVEYFQRILNIDQTNGEIWGALGHCYLMMDNLQKAYTAYQQALYHLPNPKEPKLWYGIGILYDRYGSYEHAEEAFSAVIRMEPKFEKANEIYFRLGIIYKQQGKYDTSLSCFRYILSCPPKPLTEIDIWFQIGHVYEQQKEYRAAQEAYERVLAENPNHAKVLQQLGWLYHQQNSNFSNQDLAISFLTRSLEADMNDAQTWYLLGRCYMAQQKYNKAYEAYQQAVYRDGRNPTFWCSIGVLYYQINQYRDALDAYSRAIRLNPYISEVWYDLGTLYESCNNQINDALDAYTRASELDPSNPHIKQRLQMLRNAQANGGQVQAGAAQPQQPMPQDMAYANGNGVHPNSAPQFYQGPQPPNQMSRFPGPSQQDHRQHGPIPSPMDRRELDRRDLPLPSYYPPHSQTRDERPLNQLANEAVRQQQALQQSSSGRKHRGDHVGSPKAQDSRRGGRRAAGSPPAPGGDGPAPSALDSHPHEDYPGRHMQAPRGSPRMYPADRPQERESLRPIDSQHPRHHENIPRLPEMHARQPEGGRDLYGPESRRGEAEDLRHGQEWRERYGAESDRVRGLDSLSNKAEPRTVDYTARSESGQDGGRGEPARRPTDSRLERLESRAEARRVVERSPSPPPRESSYDAAYRDKIPDSTPPHRPSESDRRLEVASPEDSKPSQGSNGRGRLEGSMDPERDRSPSAEYGRSDREDSRERELERKRDRSEEREERTKERGGERLPERDSASGTSRHEKEDDGAEPLPRAKTPEQPERRSLVEDILERAKTTPEKGQEENKEENESPSRVLPPIRTLSSSPSPPPRDGLAALASYGDDTNKDRSDSPASSPERSAGPVSETGDAFTGRTEKGERDEDGSLKRRIGSDDEGDRPERKRSRAGNEDGDADRTD